MNSFDDYKCRLLNNVEKFEQARKTWSHYTKLPKNKRSSILPRGSNGAGQIARLPKSFICFLRRRTCCFMMSLFRRPLTHRSQWQFKKGQWCLWPLRFDRTPWLLQRVHEGLRSFLMRISFSREDSSMFFLPEWTFLRATPPNIQTPTEGQVEWHELLGEAYFTRWKFHWHLPVRFKNSNHDWTKHHVHVPKLTWMSHWSHSKLRLDLSVSLFSSFYRLHTSIFTDLNSNERQHQCNFFIRFRAPSTKRKSTVTY